MSITLNKLKQLGFTAMTTDNNDFDVLAQHITRDQLTNLSPADKMMRASLDLDKEHKGYQKNLKLKKPE